MGKLLKLLWCRLTLHSTGGVKALGSVMSASGPRYLYRCKKCGSYFTEPW